MGLGFRVQGGGFKSLGGIPAALRWVEVLGVAKGFRD